MKLLLSILVIFLFAGCSDQSKKDTKQAEKVVKKVEVKKVVPEPKKVVKQAEPKKITPQKVVAQAKEKVKEVAKIATAITNDKEVQKVVVKITKALDSAPTNTGTSTGTTTGGTNNIQSVAAGLVAGFGAGSLGGKKKNSVDGGALFQSKCSSCHGAKAGKPALGKSHIIAGWDSKKISSALNGYKAGTYGGAMKAIMQGQAKGLSFDQISALASHISKL